MKCRYTFKISGQIKVDIIRPISVRGWTFEFLHERGVLSHLMVTVPANGPDDLPRITPTPAPGIKADIKVPAPAFAFVRQEVRSIEALLSVFGVHEIDVNRFKTTWIPESEEEKKKIHLNDFSTDVAEAGTETMLPMPFDLLARCVIGADEVTDMEMQLAFFRKGIVSFYEGRFIEAIYDFYFFFESMFGEGQFKKRGIEEAFKKSEPLIEAIKEVMVNPVSTVTPKKDELQSFLKKYGGMSVEGIIDHIVELRGFLHHHTRKRKEIWHPSDHKRYESEAHLFRAIACHIALKTVIEVLYVPEGVEPYKQAFLRPGPGGGEAAQQTVPPDRLRSR